MQFRATWNSKLETQNHSFASRIAQQVVLLPADVNFTLKHNGEAVWAHEFQAPVNLSALQHLSRGCAACAYGCNILMVPVLLTWLCAMTVTLHTPAARLFGNLNVTSATCAKPGTATGLTSSAGR